MEYKVEPISTDFGKGVRILKNENFYEQISCDDGLYTRIFKAQHIKDRKVVDEEEKYRGIIFKPIFKDNEKDYEKFKTLTDRLQQISGEEIPNTKAEFMDYISHIGLEKELKVINATVRINLEDKEKLPKKTNRWLNSRGHLGGLISDAAIYLGGFYLISNLANPEADLSLGLTMYGIITPVIEAVSGLVSATVNESYWCGLLHAPGFISSRIIHKKKLKNPDYVINKFLNNYKKLEKMGNYVGNQKEFSRQSKSADRHLDVLNELFPYTQIQKGFSITYDSPDKENITNLFNYILKGGNIPRLQSPKESKEKKAKPSQEKIKVKHAESNFINPWEIEVPKIGGRKNE